jgi:hypothetical protein
MDDRKRQIGEAEQRRKEQVALLDSLLASVGQALFERTDDSFQGLEGITPYRRLRGDIAGWQEAILAAEEQLARLKELEEAVEAKEKDGSLCSKDIDALYTRLGKLLLEEPSDGSPVFVDFCVPYRAQADELLDKVRSLEDRLAPVEQGEKGNVFTWIGKSAQSLVLRSFLGKAQENLEQLQKNVGERFCSGGNGSLFPTASEIDRFCAEIEEKKTVLAAVLREATDLKEEKRKISDTFSTEGGPIRYIQSLKNRISQAQNELRVLYLRTGAEASLIDDTVSDAADGQRQAILSLIRDEDREKLDKALRMKATISDCEVTVERLKASLAIDEETEKIGKYRRQIEEKQGKIAQAQRGILELEGAIRDSEAAIEKLRRL